MYASFWLQPFKFSNYRIYLYLLLGLIFGLSVYGYGLIDFSPPTSRRIIFYSVLAGLAVFLGYFLLLEFWILPRLSEVSRGEKWRAVSWGIGIGLFLMFAGTSAWASPSRYLTFLLPVQSLEISIPYSDNAEMPEVALRWLSTSLGDISYDSIIYEGWERKDGGLVLAERTNNSLRWTGKAGDRALILFRASHQIGALHVSWNGQVETIELVSEMPGTIFREYQFQVPFYASSAMVLILTSLNFIAVGLSMVLWARRNLSKSSNGFERATLKFPLTKLEDAAGQNGKNSKTDFAWMLASLLLALSLRIFNLENLYPYTDEYSHLLAAKEILAGEPWADVYQRGFFTVTFSGFCHLDVTHLRQNHRSGTLKFITRSNQRTWLMLAEAGFDAKNLSQLDIIPPIRRHGKRVYPDRKARTDLVATARLDGLFGQRWKTETVNS